MAGKAPKITKAEKEARVVKVMELIAKGLTRQEILAYVEAKTKWDVKTRTVDEYIGAAYKEFSAITQQEREIFRGEAIHNLKMVIAYSWKIADMPRVIAAQRELNKLTASYPETETQTATGQAVLKLVVPGKPRRDDETD